MSSLKALSLLKYQIVWRKLEIFMPALLPWIINVSICVFINNLWFAHPLLPILNSKFPPHTHTHLIPHYVYFTLLATASWPLSRRLSLFGGYVWPVAAPFTWFPINLRSPILSMLNMWLALCFDTSSETCYCFNPLLLLCFYTLFLLRVKAKHCLFAAFSFCGVMDSLLFQSSHDTCWYL